MLIQFILYCFLIYLIFYNVLDTRVTIESMRKSYVTNLYSYCPSLYEKNLHDIYMLKKSISPFQPYTSSLDIILSKKNPKIPIGININKF